MFGNIWLSSALIVTAIFSTSAIYKSYSDIQEAKQIQEHYEIISDIKTLLAKQYNKNPNEITRDEIIANLPSGGNWEKVLLLDRNTDSTLSDSELIDLDGNIILNEDEKIKLLALKSKLKNITDVTTMSAVSGSYTFEVGKLERNNVQKEEAIDKSIKIAIDYLVDQVVYNSVASSTYDTLITTIKDDFTPFTNIYQDMGLDKDSYSTDALYEEALKIKQKEYFIDRIEAKLETNDNTVETKLYYLIKENL